MSEEEIELLKLAKKALAKGHIIYMTDGGFLMRDPVTCITLDSNGEWRFDGSYKLSEHGRLWWLSEEKEEDK